MMARHKANHIQVAYANSAADADLAMAAKAALAAELGLEVRFAARSQTGRRSFSRALARRNAGRQTLLTTAVENPVDEDQKNG